MAKLDKSTVRNKVSRLKDDFEQLCADGKINSENKILMSSMFMIIELILSIFPERSTKKITRIRVNLHLKQKKTNQRLGTQGVMARVKRKLAKTLKMLELKRVLRGIERFWRSAKCERILFKRI